MLLVAYKGKGSVWDSSIRLWTNSIYSHCELVIDNVCYSSSIQDGGVRPKSINIYNGNWDIIQLTKFNELKALNYYQKTKSNKYSYSDLVFNQILNTRFNNPNGQFCSEWCAEALGIPNAGIYSPDKLVDLIKFMEAI